MKRDVLYRILIVLGILLMLSIVSSFLMHDETGAAPPVPTPTPTTVVTPQPMDWKEVMVKAVVDDDPEKGITAQEHLGGELLYDDLRLLAKIIACECGPHWEDWGIIAIGEVVLNRVASPEFPDTIREVLYQTDPIQYEPVWQSGWEEFVPSERYVRLALRLLEGERTIGDPSIVFQALFEQGSEVVLIYHDDDLDNNTYFCRSSYPEIYFVG